MNRILVLPQDLQVKLDTVHTVPEVAAIWTTIGVTKPDDMIVEIINNLHSQNSKLNIVGHRFETKEVIKQRVNNRGKESVYAGYLETESGIIDGLFFYIPPSLDSANDALSRQVIPSLMGVFTGIEASTNDNHFVNRPVFIVNLNELRRMSQRSVKTSIISAKMLGFNYSDVFNNVYDDIISCDLHTLSNSIVLYDNMITDNGSNRNEWFELDTTAKTLRVLSAKLCSSSNISAETYRFFLRVVPAVYIAVKEEYTIDLSEICAIPKKSDIIGVMNKHIKRVIRR